MAALGVALAFCGASAAFGQDKQKDTTALFKKVAPAVVSITTDDRRLGAGFVVDAAVGLVATNNHVIEGGEKLTVTFPADDDGKDYAVPGFVAVLPGKDLALIRIKTNEKKLQSLKLAEELPRTGESVFANGAPLGLPLVLSEGTVSVVRSGKEVSQLLAPLAGKGFYERQMGYDLDATWVQHTASIPPGTSGGPLVNSKGEVVGLNTWLFAPGTGASLQFAISSTDLKQFMAKAGTTLHPLPKRKPPPQPEPGDPGKTLAAWRAFNLAMIEFNGKIAAAEKQRGLVPGVKPNGSAQDRESRDKALSAVFNLYAETYLNFAKDVNGLHPHVTVNADLVRWIVKEGDLLRRTGECYQELAASMLTDPTKGEAVEARLAFLKAALEQLSGERDVIRINLSRIYSRNFPTLTEDEIALKTGSQALRVGGHALHTGSQALRTWTSSNGKFRIEAKLVAVEEGKVLLERTDGEVIDVPIGRLSDADQQFVKQAIAADKPPKSKKAEPPEGGPAGKR